MRNNKATAAAVRSITVLGATGSIGDSTMDLLRGAPERYRVEALTGNSNVQGLAKLAREFKARFVAVADPARLNELREALAGTGIACGAGESAIIELDGPAPHRVPVSRAKVAEVRARLGLVRRQA